MITKGLSGAEALLRILRKMGVEEIFASPGSDWAPLWEALARPCEPGDIPRYTSSRHEETAIGMAIGYAKASGKMPAVVLHTTVGALHATMALRAALHEHIPMVVLAGEVIHFGEPPAVHMGRQWMRVLADVGGPARLVEPCVKWSMAVNTPIVLPGVIARACQLAQSGPQGPVFLSIPTEMLIEAMPADAPAASALPLPPAASAEGLDQLAEALAQARAPLIITEELGRNPRAVGELVALADTLGAPVVEAWQPYYINFPRHHPLYGGIAVGEMEALVREADFVLLVESVAPWHPASALPGPGIPVAAIGADPLNVHLPVWNYRTDLVITGDAEAALRGLTERLRLRLPKGAPRPRVAALSARHAARRQKIRSEGEAAGTQKTIENRWVGHVLNQVLPGNAILVNETITHRLDLISAFDRQEAGQYFEASYGGLGLGLSIGLGIKAAQPQRPVVIAVGDGAFHYNPVIATFGAAQEHQLPVLVLLFNNAGYRSQKGDVIMEYPEGFAVRSGRFAGTSIRPRPDYALLAQAYGGYGQQVDSPAALREALERALAAVGRGQFALIDIVQPAVNPQEGG